MTKFQSNLGAQSVYTSYPWVSGTWKDVKLNWQKQSIHYRSGVHLKKLLYRSNKNYERVLHSPMFLSKSVSLDIAIIAYQQNIFWILTQIKIFFFSLWVNIHEPCTDIDDRFFLKFIRVSILWFTNFYLPRIQRSAICCKMEKSRTFPTAILNCCTVYIWWFIDVVVPTPH